MFLSLPPPGLPVAYCLFQSAVKLVRGRSQLHTDTVQAHQMIMKWTDNEQTRNGYINQPRWSAVCYFAYLNLVHAEHKAIHCATFLAELSFSDPILSFWIYCVSQALLPEPTLAHIQEATKIGVTCNSTKQRVLKSMTLKCSHKKRRDISCSRRCSVIIESNLLIITY